MKQALQSSVLENTVNLVNDVDSQVPELKPLVNDCKEPAIVSGDDKTAHLPVTVVAELKLNSVKTTAGHDQRGE